MNEWSADEPPVTCAPGTRCHAAFGQSQTSEVFGHNFTAAQLAGPGVAEYVKLHTGCCYELKLGGETFKGTMPLYPLVTACFTRRRTIFLKFFFGTGRTIRKFFGTFVNLMHIILHLPDPAWQH